MNYTESQKARMIEKIRNIRDNEVFKLNKKDVCPLDVYIVRTPRSISMIDAETKQPLFKTYGWYENDSCLRKFVEAIEEAITDWDRVTKYHFSVVARQEGRDY